MVLNPTAALYVPCINVRSVNLLNLSEVVPIFYLSVIFSNAHVKKLHIQYNRVKGSEGVTITKLQWIESIKNLFLHKTSSWIRKICSSGETMKTFFFFFCKVRSVNPHEKTHVRGLTSVPFLSSLRQMPYSSSVLQLKTKKH